MTARFRPLGATGEADPSPPDFATAPWGYRRAEVDAWASWVAGLVAHGRNETVRADSAEATLRATLERLERLESGGSDPAELPRRVAGTASAPGPEPGPDGPARGHTTVDRDAARLRLVETTLGEVMRLLHRLVGPEGSAGP